MLACKPNAACHGGWSVSRKLEMEARTCPRGAFKLSPETPKCKHDLNGPPNILLYAMLPNGFKLFIRQLTLENDVGLSTRLSFDKDKNFGFLCQLIC
ncbi:hypothetical protein DR864_28500 (plasmid) [Runella rosea]|uniref:Uncharacterized protein n=1 Tax=Runella rosea TaxID=2259595 RepID=A0A344TT45_9BACT|nr:hypothetical protein DR864_28500 [Runella rosea]